MLLWIIGFSVLGSVGAVGGAALFLLFPEGIRKVLVPCLISYATGTLLGAAFLGMIPAALRQAPAIVVTSTVLAGMVLFFVLEKLVLWRHCHDSDCEVHGRAAPLILIGAGVHSLNLTHLQVLGRRTEGHLCQNENCCSSLAACELPN